jgi:hypothetical protein
VLLADPTMTSTQANIGDRKQGRICSFTGISEHQRTTTISCIRLLVWHLGPNYLEPLV